MSWRNANPRGLLSSLISKRPRKDNQAESDYQKQLLEEFSELALDRQAMLLSIIEYWFANNYCSIVEPLAPQGAMADRRGDRSREATT